MRARSSCLAALMALVALVSTASPVSAQEPDRPLPVPYTFPVPAVLAGIRIGTDAPGTNDWTCKPTAAHPEPGRLGARHVRQQEPRTGRRSGRCWPTRATASSRSPTGRRPRPLPPTGKAFGGLTEIESSAAELKDFVARVLESTGAAQVDILGHSQGTLMPNYYAKFLGGAPFIDDYVSLASLWHGTNPLGLASLAAQGRRYGFPTPQLRRSSRPAPRCWPALRSSRRCDPVALPPFPGSPTRTSSPSSTSSSFPTRAGSSRA